VSTPCVLKWQLVQCLYDGLTKPHRQMVDASCGGTFLLKSENEHKLFLKISVKILYNMLHLVVGYLLPKLKGSKIFFEVSSPLDVTTKVDELSQKIDQLMTTSFAPTTFPHTPAPHEPCSFCSSPLHHTRDCLAVGQFSKMTNEQVNVAFSKPGNDPYSNSYNPSRRDYPNFLWRAQAVGNSTPQPHGMHNQAYQQSHSPSSNYRPPSSNINQFLPLLGLLPLRIWF
jgi:hypothetical protein